MAVAARKVPFPTKLAYGFGSVAYGVKDNGFSFFLLLYYNQVLGLPEHWVGAAILIALVFDALSDPIIGAFSDHLQSRWGRRHPFLYASALPVAISYGLLWNPPAGLGQEALFAYLVIVAVLVRTCITLFEVPSTALAAELTSDYDERTSILGLRYFFGWWGGLGMAVVAYGYLFRPTLAYPTGVLNPEGWAIYGRVAAAVMFVSILVSALGTHREIPHLAARPPSVGGRFETLVRDLKATFANRSYRALFVCALLVALGGGLTAALTIYFATYFWGLSSGQIAVLTLASFVSAALALAVAPALSKRQGKKRAAVRIALGLLALAPVPFALRWFDWLPPDGSSGLVAALLVFQVVQVTFTIAWAILISSMVADVVEDGERSTGRRTEGVFFAGLSFAQKCVSGFGIFGSTLLLALVGFPAGADPATIDRAILWRLVVLYTPLLLLVYGGAIAALARYEISRESHEQTLRSLAASGSIRESP